MPRASCADYRTPVFGHGTWEDVLSQIRRSSERSGKPIVLRRLPGRAVHPGDLRCSPGMSRWNSSTSSRLEPSMTSIAIIGAGAGLGAAVARRFGVELHELAPVRRCLEDAFMERTAPGAQRAPVPARAVPAAMPPAARPHRNDRSPDSATSSDQSSSSSAAPDPGRSSSRAHWSPAPGPPCCSPTRPLSDTRTSTQTSSARPTPPTRPCAAEPPATPPSPTATAS